MPIAPPSAVNDTMALLRVIADPKAAKDSLDALAAQEKDATEKLVALGQAEAGIRTAQEALVKANEALAAREEVVAAGEEELAGNKREYEIALGALSANRAVNEAAVADWRSQVSAAKRSADERAKALDDREAALKTAEDEVAAERQRLADRDTAFNSDLAAFKARADALRQAITHGAQ